MTTIQKYTFVFYPRKGDIAQSILISKRNSLFYSLLARGLIFSGQTSSLFFDYALILSCTSSLKRVASFPYLAVLDLCCQMFQFGNGVSSYARSCYHSGKMSSHKFGTDGASLLGIKRGKKYPKNY